MPFNYFLIDPVSAAVSISPPGPIQGAMVGDPLTIQCIANATGMLDVDLVVFNWMGPGGDTVTNNSRIIITPTSSNGNNYTSSIQFMYLMEGDEGAYMCNVSILTTTESESIMLENLTSKLYIFS